MFLFWCEGCGYAHHLETRPGAWTWNRDMAWVKWLLVDFQADLKANERAELFLEYLPEPEPEVEK